MGAGGGGVCGGGGGGGVGGGGGGGRVGNFTIVDFFGLTGSVMYICQLYT